MISQIHPINEVPNNQINNDDEVEQLNIHQHQQGVPQIDQIQINQQIEPNQIIENQDQEPQLQAQLQNYLSEQKSTLKQFLKLMAIEFVYYILELAIFSSCYSISNGQLVLDIITVMEKIIMSENTLRFFNYANEGLLPFPIGTSYNIEDIEQEIKIRNTHLLLFSQIRKLFEFGSYIYSLATFQYNVDAIQEESKFMYVSLIIYLIIRGFILIMDLLNLIKSGEKSTLQIINLVFQGDHVVNTNLPSELIFNIITSFLYLAEIVYVMVITIKNQTQCSGFNTLYYISLSVNSLIIINKVQNAVVINHAIQSRDLLVCPFPKNQRGQSQIDLKFFNLNVFYAYIRIYIFNFIYCCIAISQNIDSQCQLGDSDFNLQWSFALYFLIVRALVLGIPAFFITFSLILLLILQVAQNYTFQYSKTFQHQYKIFQLKQETVTGKLSEENLCIVCLQEFVIGEQYIRLKCNVAYLIGQSNAQIALNADSKFDIYNNSLQILLLQKCYKVFIQYKIWFQDLFIHQKHTSFLNLLNNLVYILIFLLMINLNKSEVIFIYNCLQLVINEQMLLLILSAQCKKKIISYFEDQEKEENSVYLNSSPVRKKIEKSAQKNLEAISSFQTLDNYWIPSSQWDDGRNRTTMSTNQRKISRHLTDNQTPITRFEVKKAKPTSLNKIQKPMIQYPIQRRLDSLNAQLVMLQGMSEFLGNDKFISQLIRRQPHNRQLSSLSFGI
ncbi:hypothetical protein pb186bvf_003746 [Paramecium bursaria]